MDEQTEDDLLPSTDYDITWASIIISGLFFTAGSLAFVRAFEEPPRQALFQAYKHFQTDELLGAWLFLLGTAPSIPYILVFFLIDPSAFYFFCFLGAIVLTMGTGLFVVACYPSDKVSGTLSLCAACSCCCCVRGRTVDVCCLIRESP